MSARGIETIAEQGRLIHICRRILKIE